MKNHKIWLVLLLALALRLFRIESPVLDWHAFRQADTASVTREYVKQGVDLLHPKYQDLSNIQSGLDNIQGWRMVEFPLINALIATVLKVVPFNLVIFSRLLAASVSVLGIWFFYQLLSRLGTKGQALWGAWWLAVLPYAIYYSRAVLPEPFMLTFLLISLYAFDRWLTDKSWRWWILSWMLLALAILLKPFVLFFAPVFLVLTLIRSKERAWLDYRWYLFGLSVWLPFVAWRNWITQFPSGIPAADWLFNSNGIRWRPAWFRWLFWERVGKLMLGGVGLLIAVFSFPLKKISSLDWLNLSWWLSALIYLSLIATGNVQHDYYQVLLIPGIALTAALGSLKLFKVLQQKLPIDLALTILGVLVGASLVGAWTQVSGYYNLNHREYLLAGAAVDQLTPPDALVIAPAFGDTQFLFQTNRRGWPIGFEIDKKIALGAQYYITTSYDDEARELASRYTIVKQTNDYILIDLTTPKAL